MASRGLKPVFLSRIVLTPHRENPPRTQCRDCMGGGEINDIRCRDCGGRGYFDATHPPRSSKTSENDAY
jgi:hypothetical protein